MQLKVPTLAFAAPQILTTTTTTPYNHRNLSPFTQHNNILQQEQSSSPSSTKLFSVNNKNNDDEDEYIVDDNGFLTKRYQRRKILPSIFKDYVQSLRPITLLQAVGGFWIGYFVLLKTSPSVLPPSNQLLSLLTTSLSIYISYGFGMVINDLMDRTLDATDTNSKKAQRPIASGRISPTAGWKYAGMLAISSLLLASTTPSLVWWTLSNLILMSGYAIGGWQRILIIKNVLCGWLAMSPLVGASLLYNQNGCALYSASSSSSPTGLFLIPRVLQPFATAGFAAHVAREIVKDMEDVELDARGGTKTTLPMVLGLQKSKRLAYGFIFGTYAKLILSPSYWKVLAPTRGLFSLYALGLVGGVGMCIRAYREPKISDGQKLLKKSIFIVMAGMMGGLWMP